VPPFSLWNALLTKSHMVGELVRFTLSPRLVTASLMMVSLCFLSCALGVVRTSDGLLRAAMVGSLGCIHHFTASGHKVA